MLKTLFSITLALAMCLVMTACGNEPDDPNIDPINEDVNDDSELIGPVLDWWELYNPNGFNTLTAVISNPNKVAIDVTYDCVFYKNGVEVGRGEYWSNFAILPGHKSLIWANFGIPKSTDADEVKLENVQVNKSYYEPIDGKFKYIGTTDGEAFFDFEFESKPTYATVTLVMYNDKNKNKRFDKGEIVVTNSVFLSEKNGRTSIETIGYTFTDFDLYFVAY